MLREERRSQILKYIRDKRSVTSDELIKFFKVTGETIRQDINYLSDQQQIIRTFGGAMVREDSDKSLEQRAGINFELKMKIANEALKFIRPSDLIVMDAGSTLVEMARRIQTDSEVVVITNSLEIINQLSKVSGITVIGTGGKLRSKSMSFQGSNAENTLRSYNLNKAFISAEAVGLAEGIMDTNEAEASVKRCMIEASKEVTLLADHTKFSKMAHITVCSLDRVHRIITDDMTDQDIVDALRDKGIEVIVAE